MDAEEVHVFFPWKVRYGMVLWTPVPCKSWREKWNFYIWLFLTFNFLNYSHSIQAPLTTENMVRWTVLCSSSSAIPMHDRKMGLFHQIEVWEYISKDLHLLVCVNFLPIQIRGLADSTTSSKMQAFGAHLESRELEGSFCHKYAIITIEPSDSSPVSPFSLLFDVKSIWYCVIREAIPDILWLHMECESVNKHRVLIGSISVLAWDGSCRVQTRESRIEMRGGTASRWGLPRFCVFLSYIEMLA